MNFSALGAWCSPFGPPHPEAASHFSTNGLKRAHSHYKIFSTILFCIFPLLFIIINVYTMLELLVSRKNTRLVHKYSRWRVKNFFSSKKPTNLPKADPIFKSVNRHAGLVNRCIKITIVWICGIHRHSKENLKYFL